MEIKERSTEGKINYLIAKAAYAEMQIKLQRRLIDALTERLNFFESRVSQAISLNPASPLDQFAAQMRATRDE